MWITRKGYLKLYKSWPIICKLIIYPLFILITLIGTTLNHDQLKKILLYKFYCKVKNQYWNVIENKMTDTRRNFIPVPNHSFLKFEKSAHFVTCKLINEFIYYEWKTVITKNKVFLAKAKQWLIENAFHSVTEFLDLDGLLYQFLCLQIIYFIIYIWKNYIYVLIWGVRACLVNNYFCSLFYVGCCTLVLKVYRHTFKILFSVYTLHIKLRNKLKKMT